MAFQHTQLSCFPSPSFKEAVRECNASVLAELLNDYPELRAVLNEPLFPFDTPAIVQAAGHCSRAVIEVLIRAGANINERSRWWAGGFGVLDSAPPELAEYLIEQGAIVDVHAAARLGMLDRLRELVQSQPDLVLARGGDGKTALHFASTVEIAGFLLERGADLDMLDIDHESTPAQHLVESNPEVVRYLVERGCRTDILLAAAIGDTALVERHLDRDAECIRMRVNEEFFPKKNPRSGGVIYIWTLGINRSAHQVARKFGHQQVLELLMNRSPGEVKLVNAFAVGDRATIHGMLTRQPDLIAKLTEADRAQIRHAAQDNDTQAVLLMLEYGWPVDGCQAQTPLHWAAFHGNAEMTRALLLHKASLEQIDPDYHATPLGWAIHGSEHGWFRKTGRYPDVVEALLQAGAKPAAASAGSEAVKAVLNRQFRRPGEGTP